MFRVFLRNCYYPVELQPIQVIEMLSWCHNHKTKPLQVINSFKNYIPISIYIYLLYQGIFKIKFIKLQYVFFNLIRAGLLWYGLLMHELPTLSLKYTCIYQQHMSLTKAKMVFLRIIYIFNILGNFKRTHLNNVRSTSV